MKRVIVIVIVQNKPASQKKTTTKKNPPKRSIEPIKSPVKKGTATKKKPTTTTKATKEKVVSSNRKTTPIKKTNSRKSVTKGKQASVETEKSYLFWITALGFTAFAGECLHYIALTKDIGLFIDMTLTNLVAYPYIPFIIAVMALFPLHIYLMSSEAPNQKTTLTGTFFFIRGFMYLICLSFF